MVLVIMSTTIHEQLDEKQKYKERYYLSNERSDILCHLLICKYLHTYKKQHCKYWNQQPYIVISCSCQYDSHC